MNKKVTILCFSPRKDGNCAKISNFLTDFHKRTFVHSYFVDIQPCHGCNYECLKPGENCPALTEQEKIMLDCICNSDLVYFIVPNFCGYPCANYFAFNERKVGYFNMDRSRMAKYMDIPKKFILISNSESDQFKSAMQQQTKDEPRILYLKTSKYKKQSIAGDILDSNEAITELLEFIKDINNVEE